MNKRSLTLFGIALAGLASPSKISADIITDWNDIALPLIRKAPSPSSAYQMSLVHVAQFEAVNAVVGKYTPYVLNLAAPTASPEAAAAQAAHDMLLRLYPTNQTDLDAA